MTPRSILSAALVSAAAFSPALASPASAQAQGCTQLESSAGVQGSDCGRLTVAELAVLHGDRAGG